jgi:hypothetical protein
MEARILAPVGLAGRPIAPGAAAHRYPQRIAGEV